jgi:uncharacterized protein YneF (UPF0154 family)
MWDSLLVALKIDGIGLLGLFFGLFVGYFIGVQHLKQQILKFAKMTPEERKASEEAGNKTLADLFD